MGKKTSNLMFPSIIGIIFIIIILLLVILFPCPSNPQFKVFQIVLSIAVAGFAAVIPGFFRLRYRRFLSAGGALAVFAFVYIVDPGTIITEDSCNKPFDYTVFLEDSIGNTVIKNEGTLTLQIENDKRTEVIDNKGSVTFKKIPFELKEGTLPLQIEVEGWQFNNGRNAINIKLHNNSCNIIVERDNSLCCVSGSVRDTNSTFLQNVRVSIGNIFATTDTNGRFSIEIPPDQQRNRQSLIASKEGYRIWEQSVYPSTKQEVSIILIRR